MVSFNIGALGIAGGNNNVLIGNRTVSSGLLPTGEPMMNMHAPGSDIYIHDCCYDHLGQGLWFENYATDNIMGHTWRRSDGSHSEPTVEHELRGCAQDAQGMTKYVRNQLLPGPVALEAEDNEHVVFSIK